MKSSRIDWCLGFLIVMTGSVGATARAKGMAGQAPRYAITIGTPPRIQLSLRIRSDGSGQVIHGAASYPFKADTFGVTQVTTKLKALVVGRDGSFETHYAIGFGSSSRWYTRDKTVVPALFDRAAKASGLGQGVSPYLSRNKPTK